MLIGEVEKLECYLHERFFNQKPGAASEETEGTKSPSTNNLEGGYVKFEDKKSQTFMNIKRRQHSIDGKKETHWAR